jgi:hypothetical protein
MALTQVSVGPARRIKQVKVSLYLSFTKFNEDAITALKGFLKDKGEKSLYDPKTKQWEIPYELLEDLFDLITTWEEC